jgi:ABC-2 type transport system ATP-binding protein
MDRKFRKPYRPCRSHGAVYGFLGPYGAGKTTTMKMLLGLVHPTEGSICMLGQNMNEKNRLSISGMWVPSLTRPLLRPSYAGKIWRSCVRCGSAEGGNRCVAGSGAADRDRHKQVSKFSLGMKQRLGIAAALLASELMILDEPSNASTRRYPGNAGVVKSLPAHYGMR